MDTFNITVENKTLISKCKEEQYDFTTFGGREKRQQYPLMAKGKAYERRQAVCREEKMKGMCILHQAKQSIYLQEFQDISKWIVRPSGSIEHTHGDG